MAVASGLSVEMGGTFTDLVLRSGDGVYRAFKSGSTQDSPATGVLAVLMRAAQEQRLRLVQLLAGVEAFTYASSFPTRGSERFAAEDLACLLRDRGFTGQLQVASDNRPLLDPTPYAARFGLPVLLTDAGGTTYDVLAGKVGARTPETPGIGGRGLASADGTGSLRIESEATGAGRAARGIGLSLTDAWVLLGYLDPNRFLGGSMRRNTDASAGDVSRSVRRQGLDPLTTAESMHRIAVSQMAQHTAQVAHRSSVDTAEALIVAGGGSGGLTAVAIARQLGASRVYVPFAAPVQRAYGALAAMMELPPGDLGSVWARARTKPSAPVRPAHFPGMGMIATPVLSVSDLIHGGRRSGPVLVECDFTTLVVEPGYSCAVSGPGVLVSAETP